MKLQRLLRGRLLKIDYVLSRSLYNCDTLRTPQRLFCICRSAHEPARPASTMAPIAVEVWKMAKKMETTILEFGFRVSGMETIIVENRRAIYIQHEMQTRVPWGLHKDCYCYAHFCCPYSASCRLQATSVSKLPVTSDGEAG